MFFLRVFKAFLSLDFGRVTSRMVKVSFNSALGQKDVKKDAETLIPEEDKDVEAAPLIRPASRAWCCCMCLGLALMLSGVVLVSDGAGSAPQDASVAPGAEDRSPGGGAGGLISVPVPEFGLGDPADIVHDFQRRLTAYLDLSLNKCYVIPLNTSVVMPPRDFLELLINVKAGTYLPQSYLMHEEMVVTERLEDVEQLGYFIYNLCRGKDTFKLQRRDRIYAGRRFLSSGDTNTLQLLLRPESAPLVKL
ncbi:hypothetical protein F7725_002577 [Dissostichus mawsoni]|uniref:Integral membrane protein 2 n=1 Tax=Dissostichus mawsoni TaxID=36200 RepID=A0A7J5Y5X4_DISMA|nr:hypothetical protein F7725_002577 [Dissostichus mawsoni]